MVDLPLWSCHGGMTVPKEGPVKVNRAAIFQVARMASGHMANRVAYVSGDASHASFGATSLDFSRDRVVFLSIALRSR